jgi:hypothetical protein
LEPLDIIEMAKQISEATATQQHEKIKSESLVPFQMNKGFFCLLLRVLWILKEQDMKTRSASTH